MVLLWIVKQDFVIFLVSKNPIILFLIDTKVRIFIGKTPYANPLNDEFLEGILLKKTELCGIFC